MAKIKQEINPKCADRLKELCKRFNTTQTAISEATFISQNTLSKIAQGKAPMTYNVACAIASKFPSVHVEWLMGNDDYMTDEEEGICIASSVVVESMSRTKAVRSLLHLSGYDFGNTNPRSPAEEMRDYYLHGIPVRKDGVFITNIPAEKFRLIELDIQELAELRIKSYLREVEESG